jgi:hypothetical protein
MRASRLQSHFARDTRWPVNACTRAMFRRVLRTSHFWITAKMSIVSTGAAVPYHSIRVGASAARQPALSCAAMQRGRRRLAGPAVLLIKNILPENIHLQVYDPACLACTTTVVLGAPRVGHDSL